MRYLFFAFAFIVAISCNQAPDPIDKINAKQIISQNTEIKPISAELLKEKYPTLQNVHPQAKAIMNESWYFNQIDPMAPFGSDDAADMYANFKSWRVNNTKGSPKAFVLQQFKRWGYPFFDFETTNYSIIKVFLEQNELGSRLLFGMDAAIIATAFGQLYLEGKIDADINDFAQKAIQRELLPDILRGWDNMKAIREERLKGLLSILIKCN